MTLYPGFHGHLYFYILDMIIRSANQLKFTSILLLLWHRIYFESIITLSMPNLTTFGTTTSLALAFNVKTLIFSWLISI